MVTKSDAVKQARDLHQRCIVIDTHCDTTQLLLNPEWQLGERHTYGHADLPRLREGGVAAAFFAVYATPPLSHGQGVAATRHQINLIEAAVNANANELSLADTTRDIRQAKIEGKVAIMIALEGGYLIEDSLDHLREFHSRGAVYLTLTHGLHTTWADSSGIHEEIKPLHGGLTPFGRDVIRELNRLGMMVDVSHASDDTIRDVLEVSVAPIIASHSSCQEVSPHRRNLSDEMIKAIAATGGVVQINFSAAFVDPNFPESEVLRMQAWRASAKEAGARKSKQYEPQHVTPLSVLVDHFDHALHVAGPDHVGIGSDFDGVLAVPQGMEDCSKLPYLTAELLQRGWTEAELRQVLGGNVLRVMDVCADVSHRLSRGHVEEEFPAAPM